MVICINNGGLLPGIEISQELERPLCPIKIGRDFDLHELCEHTPKGLKFLIKIYQGILFHTVDPRFMEGNDCVTKNQKILLVDDTTHTGKTIQIAQDYAADFDPLELRVATLNYISDIKPDFFILKGRCKFPWSKNSQEYAKYVEYLQQNMHLPTDNP